MPNDKYMVHRLLRQMAFPILFFLSPFFFFFFFIHGRKAAVINHGNLVTGVEWLKSIKKGGGEKNAKKWGKKFWIYCKSFAKSFRDIA